MSATHDLFRKNMTYLMEREGISSVTELARRVAMQQSTLQRVLSGEVKEPKYLTIKRLADYFHVSPVDLNECDMREEKPRTVVDVDGDPWDYEFRSVPVRGEIQPDGQDARNSAGYDGGCIRWPSYDRDAYALKCVGDGMAPRIKAGEFVIIEPGHRYVPGDEVLLVTPEEVTVKTFLFERDGIYHLLPVNENTLPVRVSKSAVSRIQYVAGVARPSLWRPR